MTHQKNQVRFASLAGVISSFGLGSSGVWAQAQTQATPPMQGTTSQPAASNGGVTPPQPSFVGALLPFVLMFGVFYFLIIRPQQKKMKQQQEMLSSLKDGDEVVTTSGILGQIRGMTDSVVTLEVADQVKIKVLRSQVAQVIKGSIKDVAQSFARPGTSS